MENLKSIIIGVLVGLILIIVFSSTTTVPTGYVGVKTRFGKVQEDVINEGLNLKVPFIEKIVKINCKTQIFENDKPLESSTKDMQIVKDIYVATNYCVDKSTANSLYQKIGKDYEKILIVPAMQESVKSAFSQFTAEELITNRSQVSELIKEQLVNKLAENGITVSEISIKNFDFSAEYNKAIEEKATAQQNVAKAKAELEKAQVDNQQKIENAKAEAEVRELQSKSVTEKSLEQLKLEIQREFVNKWNRTVSINNVIRKCWNIIQFK